MLVIMPDKFSLPTWKKFNFKENRGVEVKDMEFEVNRVMVHLEERIRKVLLLVKVTESHDANARALADVEVRLLQDTLDALGGQGSKDGLIKEGIIYGIIHEYHRLIPYKGHQREKIVRPKDQSSCVGCGISVCIDCSRGSNISVCSPCKSWISEKFKMPKELYRANHKRKNNDTNSQVSDSQFSQQQSLPCGQGSPRNSQPSQGPSHSYADVDE